MAKQYTAVYAYGDDGWWTVSIKEIPGVHTQGRNIAEARRRIREALGMFVEDAATAELVDDIRVSPVIQHVLYRAHRAHLAAERQKQRAAMAPKAAAPQAGVEDQYARRWWDPKEYDARWSSPTLKARYLQSRSEDASEARAWMARLAAIASRTLGGRNTPSVSNWASASVSIAVRSAVGVLRSMITHHFPLSLQSPPPPATSPVMVS